MAEQIHHTLLPEDSEEEIEIGGFTYSLGEGKYYEPSARTLSAVSVSREGLEYKGTPVIHSRIQGESTYSKDFGGIATDIEYVDGGVYDEFVLPFYPLQRFTCIGSSLRFRRTI